MLQTGNLAVAFIELTSWFELLNLYGTPLCLIQREFPSI